MRAQCEVTHPKEVRARCFKALDHVGRHAINGALFQHLRPPWWANTTAAEPLAVPANTMRAFDDEEPTGPVNLDDDKPSTARPSVLSHATQRAIAAGDHAVGDQRGGGER